MPTKIFVNLCVKDLKLSKEFFSRIGFNFNPQFTNEEAACMVISNDIFAMLLTEPTFRSFTTKAVADATKTTEVLLGISADSREKVNELVDKAVSAGATESRPATDHGFMFTRTFDDLDGHTWEILWMDPAQVQS